MKGFYLTNLKNVTPLKKSSDHICEQIECNGYYVSRTTIKKFELDKTLYENKEFVILIDGVILNKLDLYEKYHATKIEDLVVAMFHDKHETFFELFRGSFSGCLFYKPENLWIIFTNHYGDAAVFYYADKEQFIFASQITDIIDTFQRNDIPISLNKGAVTDMLTYGFMSDNKTYANEIHRLLPGHYIRIQDGKMEDKKYFSIKHDAYELKNWSNDKIIDELDQRFRKAVTLEFDKDKEYGYRHFCSLSGGLDSRMTFWVARDLGYDEILCLTFGQSNCKDEQIAKEILHDTKQEMVIFPMDGSWNMYEIDKYMSICYGLLFHSGAGLGFRMMETLNTKKFGLTHSGQIGDAVIGSFLKKPSEQYNFSIGGTYSLRLVDDNAKVDGFETREQYLMSVRAFLGALSSHFYTREYTEVSSPFLYKEFFDFCMSIPVEKRINHFIYKEWIKKKYPEAVKYVWEATGKKITRRLAFNLPNKLKILRSNPKLILTKLGLPYHGGVRIFHGMNPIDLWWDTNERFRDTYNDYYKKNITNLILPEELRKQIETIYEKGTAREKSLAITVLGAIKLYF